MGASDGQIIAGGGVPFQLIRANKRCDKNTLRKRKPALACSVVVSVSLLVEMYSTSVSSR